jgi:galactokinase
VTRVFVPGRLCLFGEHSDWAGTYRGESADQPPGYCLVMGTDQGLHADVEARATGFEVTSELPGGAAVEARLGAEPAALAEAARAGGFFSYAAGTAAEVAEQYGVGGLALRIRADLPVGKGLSSSAAICVLVARAYSRAYGLGLTEREEVELAYAGERRTGSECGRMDQICAYGRRPTFLRFDGPDLDVEVLRPAAPLHLLVVDLCAAKDTIRILRDLNACFPDAPGAIAAGVREALGPSNEKLLRRAREALVAGAAAQLGGLMEEAQTLFDARVAPACDELRAPRLHEVLAHGAARELAYGGKGVGSQGDGCAQLVARDAEARTELATRLERDLGVSCLPLTILPELD